MVMTDISVHNTGDKQGFFQIMHYAFSPNKLCIFMANTAF